MPRHCGDAMGGWARQGRGDEGWLHHCLSHHDWPLLSHRAITRRGYKTSRDRDEPHAFIHMPHQIRLERGKLWLGRYRGPWKEEGEWRRTSFWPGVMVALFDFLQSRGRSGRIVLYCSKAKSQNIYYSWMVWIEVGRVDDNAWMATSSLNYSFIRRHLLSQELGGRFLSPGSVLHRRPWPINLISHKEKL